MDYCEQDSLDSSVKEKQVQTLNKMGDKKTKGLLQFLQQNCITWAMDILTLDLLDNMH